MNEIIGPRAFGVENQITEWLSGTEKLLPSHKSLCEKLAPPLQVTVAVVIAYGATMTDNPVNRFFNTGPKIAHADDDNAPDMNVGLSNIQNPIPSFSELINAIPDPTIIGAFDENPELSEETQEWSLKTTKGVFTRTSTGVLRFTENGIPGQKNVWVVKLGEQNLSEQDHAYSRGENELFAFEVANPPQSYYAQSENLEPVIEPSSGDNGGATLEQAIVNGFTGPGFQSIFMAMPLVGKAISPETPLANGDVMQLTENGAMFWRKADNWTAYTNGSRTWVMGPYGLYERGNNERFDWESPEVVIVDKPGDPGFREKVEKPLQYLQKMLPELRKQDQAIYGPICEAIEVMTKYGVTVRYEKELFPSEGTTFNILDGKQPLMAVRNNYTDLNHPTEIRAIVLAHELRHINDTKNNPKIGLDGLELGAHGQNLTLARFFQVGQFYITYFESELENQREIFSSWGSGK